MIELPIKSNILFSKKWEGQILDFEITPVKADTDEDGTEIASACDESEANAFGVYARMQEGTAEWLADWETKEAAEAFIAILRHVGYNFCGPGITTANPKGFIFLKSVQCFYHPETGQTFPRFDENGIDYQSPVHLSEVEIGDWYLTMSDEDWNTITSTGMYANLNGYTREQMAEYTDDTDLEVTLSEIIPQSDRWNAECKMLTMDSGHIYYIEKVA